MYCAKCGKKIQDDAKFCGYCGTGVTKPDISDSQNSITHAVQENAVSDEKKKNKLKHIISVVFLFIASVCAVIGGYIYIGNNNGKHTPTIYLTCDYELSWMAKADAINITSFNPTSFSDYYNNEDSVFYSNDGNILYYFDLTEGYGGAPLYCIKIDELNDDRTAPTLIDDYAVTNRALWKRNYIMETLDNGGLLYMGADFSEQCYTLKYYDGKSSSILAEGKEIYVSFNSEKTLANICVFHDTREENGWIWYRMVIDDRPVVEYVCDGTIYPFQHIDCELDFQTMAENDIIICISNYENEHGYYSVDLYDHGQWRECLIEKLPWYSVGTFGISVDGEDVSFYVISTTDLLTTTGRNYENIEDYDSEQWTFYHYEKGILTEVSEELRFQMNLPGNAIYLDSIHYINNELLYICGSPYEYTFDEYVSVKETGTDFEITQSDSFPEGFWHDFDSDLVFSNDKGERILFSLYDDTLYAYSDGVERKIAESINDFKIYKKQDEKLLVAYGNGKLYSMKINDIDMHSIETNILVFDMIEEFITAIPYSENKFLCISYDDELWIWDGKKSKRVCSNVMLVWSDYRREYGRNLERY